MNTSAVTRVGCAEPTRDAGSLQMLQDAKTALKKVPGAGRGGVNRIPELEVWPCILGGGYGVDKGEGDQAKDLFGEW